MNMMRWFGGRGASASAESGVVRQADVEQGVDQEYVSGTTTETVSRMGDARDADEYDDEEGESGDEGLHKVNPVDDPDQPEVLVTSSSEKLLIPVFLRDYTEQQKENLGSTEYEVLRIGVNDHLVLTRGVVDKSRKVLFDPERRMRQFWLQFVGLLMFTVYEVAIVLCKIHVTDPKLSKTLQYILYGGLSSAIMLPLVGMAFYKCSWQYLTTHTRFIDWLVFSMQVFLPLPFGHRYKVYGRRHFPWFTLLIISAWVMFYILAGPGGRKLELSSGYCHGNAITFGNLMANFMHLNMFHLLSNSIILLCFAVVTEVAYGAWRAFLPVIIGLPLIEPMYGFCGYFGGSALWGLLSGSAVAVWFSTLHWNGNWDEWNYPANYARGFGVLWIMNVVQVLGDIVRAQSDVPIANWVHASAQFTGFLLGMAIMPAFEREVLHAPGEFGSKDAKPEKPTVWYYWYRLVAVVGLVGFVTYLIPGLLWKTTPPPA